MTARRAEMAREWTRQDWILAGLIVGALLVAALLIIVPAFAASSPPDAPQCRLAGYVYGAEDLDEVAAVIVVQAGCPIDVARFERRLVLTSARWRVEMEIPRSGGWQQFAYTWGQDRAYIGAREVPITVTPREVPA